MTDEVNIAFHAARLLENPAWARGVDEIREQLARERDGLAWDDPRRQYVTIAETLLTKLERRFAALSQHGRIEQFHKQQAGKVA